MRDEMSSAVNRRKVLSSLGVGSLIGTAGVTLANYDNSVEVVMEWQGDEPYVTRKVPKQWYKYIQKSARLAEQLTEKYSDNDNVYGFNRVAGDLNRGGKSAPQLNARIRKGSGAEKDIPNRVKNVPISITKVENNEATALTDVACKNNGEYDYLWAGVIAWASNDSDDTGDEYGTTMAPAHKDGNHYCVTANHLFMPNDFECDTNWEDKAWQHSFDGDHYIGEVYKYNQEMDYAMIPLSKDLDPMWDVRSADWDGPISSHVSPTRLAELVENDTTVAQMGVTTGETWGDIQKDKVDVDKECLDTKNDAFKCSANAAKGDSGGPVYTPSESEDGISMIGLVSGTRNWIGVGEACDGKTIYKSFWGPPAWKINDQWGLNFYAP